MDKHKDNKNHENIFEILDGIMFQLGKTKKIFLIMIITTLIIPPIALIVMTSVFDSPFHDKFDHKLEQRLKENFQRGELTEKQIDEIKERLTVKKTNKILLQPPQLVIFGISLVWLAIGIRQWVVLSKWDKRYQQFKKKQREIDEEFKDESSDKHNEDQ